MTDLQQLVEQARKVLSNAHKDRQMCRSLRQECLQKQCNLDVVNTYVFSAGTQPGHLQITDMYVCYGWNSERC